MSKILNEGLDYHDLEGIVIPRLTVDEYAAQMGKDSEIVTIAFIVKNKQAGEDLSDWFERGYDFVLDAQVSDGELSSGKYLVFVEMNRRTTVPERIITLLDDLETLTALPVIGVPVALKHLDGMDSLLSIVQMPAGVPVATVGVGNAKNAALLAARILGISDSEISSKVVQGLKEINRIAKEKGENLNSRRNHKTGF